MLPSSFFFRLSVLSLFCGAAFSQPVSLPFQYIDGTPALHTNLKLLQLDASISTIPYWSTNAGGYTYFMAGQNPLTAGAGSTTIPVQIIPLVLIFAEGTVLDPTATDPVCSPAGTATTLTMASPLFGNFNFSAGGTAVGNTQYADFFQRANYWRYIGPGGPSPNYHVLLQPTLLSPIRVQVPASLGVVNSGTCGKEGLVQLDAFDNYLQTEIPQLAASGVRPTTLPVFLTYNVASYSSSPSDCTANEGVCAGGWHNAYQTPSGDIQTYAIAEFDSLSGPGRSVDIAVLSHEIGEWMDNPFNVNKVPSWGTIGQVKGCQDTLEVGDPLTGTWIPIVMTNGVTYHVQELAFTSWFFGQSPSTGVNGWYSSNGTFNRPATACVAPHIATVSTILPKSNQTITIAGSGFGTYNAYNGTSQYLEISDLTGQWNAGFGNNPVTLNVISWSDSQIVVQGLTGAYGQNNWVLRAGDHIQVLVWNPQTNAQGNYQTTCKRYLRPTNRR